MQHGIDNKTSTQCWQLVIDDVKWFLLDGWGGEDTNKAHWTILEMSWQQSYYAINPVIQGIFILTNGYFSIPDGYVFSMPTGKLFWDVLGVE